MPIFPSVFFITPCPFQVEKEQCEQSTTTPQSPLLRSIWGSEKRETEQGTTGGNRGQRAGKR